VAGSCEHGSEFSGCIKKRGTASISELVSY
jgi:hypothetical protein